MDFTKNVRHFQCMWSVEFHILNEQLNQSQGSNCIKDMLYVSTTSHNCEIYGNVFFIYWFHILAGAMVIVRKGHNLTHLSRDNLPTLINRMSPFLILRMLGGIFPNFNRTFCKQIVKILIRHRIMRCLIWVCTLCLISCSTKMTLSLKPDHVAQSVTCLATDTSLTADLGVSSSFPAPSHTFVEIDHETISTVILLPSAESFYVHEAKENMWLGELNVPP